MAQRDADLVRIRVQLHREFTPDAPITHKSSLQGRLVEVDKVLSAVMRRGAHAVIFGERGVGKTSLAMLIEEFWNALRDDNALLTARVTCNANDDYPTIWANVANEVEEYFTEDFMREQPEFTEYVLRMADGEASPNFLRRAFQAHKGLAVIIFDEFDRLEDPDTSARMADTIKGLSDHGVEATVVLVGVADTIEQLIGDHPSVYRCITQILLPRLSEEEIVEVVQSRYDRLGVEYDASSLQVIARLAGGLPYYAHLLGQAAALAAVRAGRAFVDNDAVRAGLALAMDNVLESVLHAHQDATFSRRPSVVRRQTLLACALARRDELGYFTATDVRQHLEQLQGKQVSVGSYHRFLTAFCGDESGNVLRRDGAEWRRRYRFADPLLECYVKLKGIQDGLITAEDF